MALHDPTDDLQQQAELDRLTREQAYLILSGIRAGSRLNITAMIDALGEYLGGDQALGDLIQRTARGENAFGELLQKLALDAGEKQARAEMAAGARRRTESHEEQRIERALDAAA